MALVTWKDIYSVKVKSIDDQHRMLMDILNELHDAVMARVENKKIEGILHRLIQYTLEHFSLEEGLLARHNYPELAAHQEEHRKLTSQVKEFAARLSKGEETIGLPMLRFLQEWLTGHILNTDNRYSSYLRERGVV